VATPILGSYFVLVLGIVVELKAFLLIPSTFRLRNPST
jgi:hypothetical protein